MSEDYPRMVCARSRLETKDWLVSSKVNNNAWCSLRADTGSLRTSY